MSADSESRILARTVRPILDSIETIRRARAQVLSPDDREEFNKEIGHIHVMLLWMMKALSHPCDEERKEPDDRRLYFPSAAYTAISKVFTDLANEDVESFRSDSLQKHVQVIDGAIRQSLILIHIWSVVAGKDVAEPEHEPKSKREAKRTMEATVKHGIRQAEGAGLYNLLVEFTRKLGSKWTSLTLHQREELNIEAMKFCESGKTRGIVTAVAGESKPWPESGTFPLIGEVLAASDSSEASIGSAHTAVHAEHSLAIVSPRKRAIYGFSSAL